MGQVQGVSTPLVVKTRVEKIRMIKLSTIIYRTIRSFTESSLKDMYPWRKGYEYPDRLEWVKDGKWVLTAFKKVTKVDANELPVEGIYKITDSVIPSIILRSPKTEILFVVLSSGEIGILYTNSKVSLAITARAPVAFVPAEPLPYARPISIREIVGTLSYYVSF